MTAKQALLERVETMTEEEAEELLHQLDWDSTEFEALTEAEIADLREAEHEVERGETVSAAEVLRRLGR